MNLHSWMGVRAAQKTAGKGLKPSDRQHHIVSAIIGILLAVLVCAGLVVGQSTLSVSSETIVRELFNFPAA
jgi:CBS-domain-containing membrane protein